jgi:hypothetical protein
MANIFKSLAPTDYTITPFPAYYNYKYVHISGSTSNSLDLEILYGEKFDTSSNTTRYPNPKYDLFSSIVQTFYSPLPYAAYGIKPGVSFIPENRIQVVSITQDVYGEKIVPGSFNIVLNTSESYDDGKGNIIVSSSGVGDIVGTIFYDKGIAVLHSLNYNDLTVGERTTGVLDNRGIFIASGSTVKVNFSSSITLFEHTYKVKINPTEFLYSLNNPTVTTTPSGSTKTYAELGVDTGALPYITTIGFYNKDNELLMVAKPSVPIQRTKDVTQTFIVRFDT